LLRNCLDRRVVILSRTPQTIVPSKNVTAVQGDLKQRNLGMEAEARRSLTDSVTEIIHCAADIRFRLPIREARSTNVTGTRRMLALARRCRRLEKFAHVSTVYIAGKTSGVVSESRLSSTAGFLNSYQRSKHEAEQAVFEAMRDVPASIFRLSSIISDSNGTVRQCNYFHRVLRMVPRNPFPIFPGDGDAPLDLIASDWAASALALLYDSRFSPGRVYHVCAGSSASMTLAEIIGSTFEVVNARRRSLALQPAAPPRLVGLEEFESFARKQTKIGTAAIKELLRIIREFVPQLAIRQCFENTETLGLLERAGLSLPPVRKYYPRVVEFCLGGAAA
jgi:nucleoside-diphosphate-sugar epimerase